MSPMMTVNEMIREHPDSVEVFNRLGIDSCCGGDLNLKDAAENASVDPVLLERELRRVTEGAT